MQVAITRDADQADVYHRTCTHSLAFLAVSAVLFIGLAKWVEGLVDRTPSLRFLTQSMPGVCSRNADVARHVLHAGRGAAWEAWRSKCRRLLGSECCA